VSEQDEDLELQALERQLDDAFETTRPRHGFEDELWLRMQSSRPAGSRLRDAWIGFWDGIRAVPAVPAAAVAVAMVVVIAVVLVGYSGILRPGGGASSTAGSALNAAPNNRYPGDFGRVPTPVFAGGQKTGAAAGAPQPPSASDYAGPAQLTWTGHLDVAFTVAPVFRYQEPSTNTADQFASSLGAPLYGRPEGFLGMYETSDYTLKVRGTVAAPPSSPAYFIFSNLSMAPIEAAGAGPADLASVFLAEHSLVPQWDYTIATDSSGDPIKVFYQREFNLPGGTSAYLVNTNGDRYGIEVDLSNNRPVLVSGMLPVNMDSASYQIITSDQAVRAALGSSQPVPVTGTAAPAVVLTQAELVYVLVPAGDHSFYEPAFMFSGTVKINGTTLTKRVLVPAVDPSQRTP
jgi:hypothetical protein